MTDKRQHPRFQLNETIRVYHKNTGRVIGRVLDITPGGMMIMGAKAFKKKESISFNLVFPTEVERCHSIDVDGLCVWCEHSTYSDDYVCGFKFTNIDAKGSDVINCINRNFSDGQSKPEFP